MANAIGEKMGYDVQFVETEWDSITAALDAGNFDVVMNQVTITDERKEKFDFSTPYIYSKPVLIVAADNTDINSFEDINGKKAAEGLTSNFSDIARSYGAEIVGQDKFALAMECVLSCLLYTSNYRIKYQVAKSYHPFIPQTVSMLKSQ